MLKLTSSQLPVALSQLSNPVKNLFIEGGDLEDLMKRPRLAVVGSRKISNYGYAVTTSLVNELVQSGVVIVSGLALGVDSIAHNECLKAKGQTIAVLPSGLDKIYPSSHSNLAKQILDCGGALVTEYPNGTTPYQSNFLERNRIIAGLSDGVLVTEAAIRSGSLNTANHALQIGLPVLVVPGNITSPMSAGCNNLIKAGAVPVTCVDDILNALKWKRLTAKNKNITGSNSEEQIIIDLLKSGISDGSELLSKTELSADIFNQTMTMLEITAKIRPISANNWTIF